MQETIESAIIKYRPQKITILLILHTVLYFQMWEQLFSAWQNKPQVSHGYLIIPISIWLLNNIHKKSEPAKSEPSIKGVFLVSVGLILYMLASVSEVATLANVSYMISLAGLIVALFGFSTFKAYLFPYLFLFFMFPIPDILYLELTSPLKLFASNLSTSFISLLGFNVIREGNILQLPHFQMQVVEACSGMQSLISFVMLGVLLAFFFKGPCWKKFLIISFAIPIAILNNILRISGTGIVGELYGEKAVNGVYHSILGMASFSIGLMIFFILYHLLSTDRSS
jgi:exosortase